MRSLLTKEDIEARLTQSGWRFIKVDDSGTSLYGHRDSPGDELPIRWDAVRLGDLVEMLVGAQYIT